MHRYAKLSARDQQTDPNQAAAGPSEQPLEQAIPGLVQKPLDQVAAGPTTQPSDQAKAVSLPQHSPATPSFDAIHRCTIVVVTLYTICAVLLTCGKKLHNTLYPGMACQLI